MISGLLFPRKYKKSIFNINFADFYKKGYRAVIFDIDNTLAKRYTKKPCKKTIAFLNGLKTLGFSIALLSNNSRKRVKLFNEELGFVAIHRAGKPGTKGITKALNQLGIPKSHSILVGDQIFTDCICGNRCGIYTILVEPIHSAEEWFVRLKRLPEKLVLGLYKVLK